jgi:hypothetical protein
MPATPPLGARDAAAPAPPLAGRPAIAVVPAVPVLELAGPLALPASFDVLEHAAHARHASQHTARS